MSDSSNSEENDCLKEAVDPTFFSNELYAQKSAKAETSVELKLPSSKRNKHQQTSSFNPLEIRATPEFRAYVSKHLHKILDKIIDDSEELDVNEKPKFKSKSKGVKLLKTSKHFLNEFYEECYVPQRRKHKKKRRKVDNESSSDEEKRIREVAVTADWILSGKATEGWVPCIKGEVEVITIKSSKK